MYMFCCSLKEVSIVIEKGILRLVDHPSHKRLDKWFYEGPSTELMRHSRVSLAALLNSLVQINRCIQCWPLFSTSDNSLGYTSRRQTERLGPKKTLEITQFVSLEMVIATIPLRVADLHCNPDVLAQCSEARAIVIFVLFAFIAITTIFGQCDASCCA